MTTENWETAFRNSLIARAHAVVAEFKGIDADAEARAHTYPALLACGLFCPECWVRHGETTTLHQKRWLVSCGEHDFKVA